MFVTRRVHRLEVAHRDERIRELAADRDYWRSRAERLMDQTLARAGAISQPTMVERKVTDVPSGAALITTALGVTEIDSSKRKES